MTTKKKDRTPGNYENCVTKDRQERKYTTEDCVKQHNALMKGVKIERIPIFRGWIEKEVKS